MRILFFLYRVFARQFYNIISSLDNQKSATLMNYGYIGNEKISIPNSQEDKRTRLQLYHHIAIGTPIENKIVLEVGSGRGGGAHYIATNFRPKKYTGIDFSEKAVEFCRTNYNNIRNLDFKVGDAQNIPFSECGFDIVLNVESSHCYADTGKFFREVNRVLKPKGIFLYADFFPSTVLENRIRQLRNSGFELIKKESIRKNVLKAMENDHMTKLTLIRNQTPPLLHGIMKQFSGTKESLIFTDFKSNKLDYWNFILRKN